MIIIAVLLIIILLIIQMTLNSAQPSLQNKTKEIIITKTPGRKNVDDVREYDYRKMRDPLEEPTRRVPRHELPPKYFKDRIDFPTRGYPDNFTQYGVLVRVNKKGKSEENNILRLYGRQEYPGSDIYEYYTAVNSGLDQIKIPLNIKKRELYDDDIVFVDELNAKYKVKLHKYDAPKYYPDIIW